MSPSVAFTRFEPDNDVDELVAFLASNTFPFHRSVRRNEQQARDVVESGRFWSEDSLGFWIDAEGGRLGIVVLDDVGDIAAGGSPVFDLRLGEDARGRGLGVAVLRALTDMVFARWPTLSRFEGSTRDDNQPMRATFRKAGWVKEAFHREAWVVEGGAPRGAVTYAVLRRDWESGTHTPVEWDDL